MADWKVMYFPLYARAESTRMALAHAKANWEDERIPGEKWMEIKATMPNGQMPALVHGGKTYNESVAILRFVGKHFGYYPENHTDAW